MSDRPLAVITGTAHGIGRACAEAIAADGARLALVDIEGDGVRETADEIGDGTLTFACNMGDADQVARTFEAIEAEAGAISILVNNAGSALPQDFLETSLADFKAVIDVNLTGTFLALQLAAKSTVRAGIKGAIVNMSSINAQVAIPSIAAYCASKGGVMQLTRASALALAPHGIRANAVGPGSIDTAMMAGVNANPEAMAMVMSRTPSSASASLPRWRTSSPSWRARRRATSPAKPSMSTAAGWA